MLKVVFGLQSAPGQERVRDADGGGVSERHSDIEIIIAVKKGIVNDVEDVPLIVVPIFVGKLRGDLFKLIGKTIPAENFIITFQHGGHSIIVFRTILPQIDVAGIVSAAGVRNVKHIFEPWPVAVGVD